MKLLVDGYNLLHASGVFGRASEEPTLETARRALLDFLAQQLTERERLRTTVVFDGKDAPRGLPAQGTHEKMQIVFSRRRTNADELIAEMIAAEPAPRELVVVSSDHGVQRVARQRGIESHDSELWCRMLRERASQESTPRTDKPEAPQSAAEIQHWLQEFSPPGTPEKKPAPHLRKQAKTKPQDER